MEKDGEQYGNKGSDNDGGKVGTKASGQPTIVVVPRHGSCDEMRSCEMRMEYYPRTMKCSTRSS